MILYNVPSRTGCNLLPETCAALAGHPRIAAVKEASGNLSQIVSLFHRAAARLDVYSGNDDQIVPILAMGGGGCISVLSNVLPREAVQLCELFFSGDVRGAAALQCRLLPKAVPPGFLRGVRGNGGKKQLVFFHASFPPSSRIPYFVLIRSSFSRRGFPSTSSTIAVATACLRFTGNPEI